jgi:hypothetical protein
VKQIEKEKGVDRNAAAEGAANWKMALDDAL